MPPPKLEGITERSQKFYNGTYKWDSEGFTDDMGVYRKFNCYDPAARAPTPLPPMSLADEDKEEALEQTTVGGTSSEHGESRVTRAEGHHNGNENESPDTPSNSPQSKLGSLSVSSSSLSDCPSDISEWEGCGSVPQHKANANNEIPEDFELKVEKPKAKPGTRGVAQKVKEGAKKPTASTTAARRRSTRRSDN